MSFVCRRGHHSISDDFCDVCGEPAEKITSINLTAGEFCPDCPERAEKDRSRLDAYAATGPPD